MEDVARTSQEYVDESDAKEVSFLRLMRSATTTTSPARGQDDTRARFNHMI